jgi:hypothetical protein
MKRILTAAIFAGTLFVPGLHTALAASNPSPTGTGQPSQGCLSQTALMEPGNAASARGSAFNENGGIAGSVYANPGSTGGTSSGNTHVVSQYDVACYQVSNKP